MEINQIYKAIQDPGAELWLLTGPRWAGFIGQALRTAQDSIFFSMYLLSPHWGRESNNVTNLLREICVHGTRLHQAGRTCRVILGHPTQSTRVASYNREAADLMHKSGWDVRIMPAKRVLHEKVWLFDRKIAVIGSHNVSVSSAITNLDCSVAIHSELFASEVLASWWRHWDQATPYNRGNHSNGESDKPDSTHRFTSRFQPGGAARNQRII